MKKQKYLDSTAMSLVLFVFLFLMSAVVYMTKSMFSSAMATIVEEGFMTKSQTGLINAAFWFVYALFQVIGGFAVDKYSPYKLIMIGMFGAVISNVVIYFNQTYSVMMAAWTFNAAAQFGVWPGAFKVLSTQLKPTLRKTAVFWMLFSTSVGLGMSMLIASFVKHWKQNFLVSAISLSVMLVIYAILNHIAEKRMVEDETEKCEDGKQTLDKAPMMPLMLRSGLAVLLIVCLLRNAIDNGIKMLTPVMLMESYETLPAAIATRISSVLIIFSAIGTLAAGFMQKRVTSNETKAQIVFYVMSVLPLTAVCFVGNIHYVWILIALCLTVLALQGASPFTQSFVTLHFEKYGRIGTVSGIINATASLGNIMASYIFAKMAEMMSWAGVTVSWLLSIVLCIILCAAVYRCWTRFTRESRH